MNSQAERTIREHHPRDTAHQDSRQLVKGNDGHVYPKNPDTPYISRFPGRFLGSLECGSLDHVFRAFPQKSSPEMKQKLFQDLQAFSIYYIPENTFKLCSFLVQIIHAESALLNLDLQNTGDCHIMFISRYTYDSHLCDDTARWWPLRHDYKDE